jgi:hypothetical protein
MKNFLKIKNNLICINFRTKENLYIHEICIPQTTPYTLICDNDSLANIAIEFLKTCCDVSHVKISKTNKISIRNKITKIKKIYMFGNKVDYIITDYIKKKELKTIIE